MTIHHADSSEESLIVEESSREKHEHLANTARLKLDPILQEYNRNPCVDETTGILYYCHQLPFSCFLCSALLPSSIEAIHHLLEMHHIRVDNVEDIIDVSRYFDEWVIFLQRIPDSLRALNQVDPTDTICSSDYPYDNQIRQNVRHHVLTELLKIQDKERHSLFESKCLFCTKYFSDNLAIGSARSDFFHHMFLEHHFNIGLPDNLVFISDFLAVLKARLDAFQCLYCNLFFPNFDVLREHMRKKKHLKISEKNCYYDKYYLINYTGKKKEELENSGDDEGSDTMLSDGFSDLDDDHQTDNDTLCLFCEKRFNRVDGCVDHMLSSHGFDLLSVQTEHAPDFYAYITLINYIRSSVRDGVCIGCRLSYESIAAHMESARHFTLMHSYQEWRWNDKYLQPVVDNDPLLHSFELNEVPKETSSENFDSSLSSWSSDSDSD